MPIRSIFTDFTDSTDRADSFGLESTQQRTRHMILKTVRVAPCVIVHDENEKRRLTDVQTMTDEQNYQKLEQLLAKSGAVFGDE